MPETSKGIGCFVTAALLLTLASFILYPAIRETMRGMPLTSEPEWHAAEGGERLTGGGRAARGEMVKPAGVVLSDHLVGLLVGGGAAVLGILAILAGIGDYQEWKRSKSGKD